jgi:hypothetical protein
MFHSGVFLAKAIHDDRVREMERAVRDRRLLQPTDESFASTDLRAASKAAPAKSAPLGRSASAREPA